MLIRSLLALALIAAPAAAQVPDTAATKASVIAADRALALAVSRGGPDAFLRALTPGGVVLIPGQQILKGAIGARAAFTSRYRDPASYTWWPTHAVASTDGKLACTFGYSRFVNALDSVRIEHPGTYITCFARDPQGTWKVAGTQRHDTQPKPAAFADSSWLPGGPHSSTFASGKNPLGAAITADSLFAVMGELPAGPGPAFAKYVAEDGQFASGEEFARGPAGMTAGFAGYSPDRVLLWRPMRDVGAGSGGLAFTVGHATSGPRAGKSGPTSGSKYFSVWRQEPNGEWKWIWDLGTGRPVN